MAVVWGTVKDRQGYISVQSEEGKGSIFNLFFPVTREALSAEPGRVSVDAYSGKGERILVVDEVKGQRDLTQKMLTKLNYTVHCAARGEEAVDYLKDHRVDLVILDMIMDPGIDGLETYKRIIALHPRQKAIVVSGFSETERVNAAQVLGAGAYVKKILSLGKDGVGRQERIGEIKTHRRNGYDRSS